MSRTIFEFVLSIIVQELRRYYPETRNDFFRETISYRYLENGYSWFLQISISCLIIRPIHVIWFINLLF